MGGTQGNHPGRHGFFTPGLVWLYFTFLAHRFYRIFSTRITFWAPKKLSKENFHQMDVTSHFDLPTKKNPTSQLETRDLQLQPRSFPGSAGATPQHPSTKSPAVDGTHRHTPNFFLQQAALSWRNGCIFCIRDIPPRNQKFLPQISCTSFYP